MLKKLLMVTLYIAIGYQSMAAVNYTKRGIASQAPSKNICMIQSGDIGKLKYKGSSMEDAFTKVTDDCFQKRTAMFKKMRNQEPTQERQIEFAEACVNSVKCI